MPGRNTPPLSQRRPPTLPGNGADHMDSFEQHAADADHQGAEPRGHENPSRGLVISAPSILPARADAEAGIDLLDDLVSVFSRYVVLPSGGAEAAALWIVHAHAHDAATISPILAITSPVMRCGKTTMLELLQALTPNPLMTCNVTAPALFRLIDKYSP